MNIQKNVIDTSVVWDDENNFEYNYHILGKQNWESVNALIKEDKHRDPHNPVTFADNVIVNHIRSQVDHEIKRFENRENEEYDQATRWWRSSYPKFIVWHYLVLATLDQRMISQAQLTRRAKLSRSGVANILLDACEMDYINQKSHGAAIYYCASNETMQGFVYRLKREQALLDPMLMHHYYSFQQYIKFLEGGMHVDRIFENSENIVG